MFEGVLGDEVDDGDGAALMLPPGAGDPLFEASGVPREVAIDDDAGVLEIEAHAAGVGAEKQAAGRVIPEGEDLATAFLLGDAAGMPCVADRILLGPGADSFQHPFPLGENDDFHVGIGEGFVEDDDVGLEAGVDVEAIGDDLLVVYDGEKRRITVGGLLSA